MSFSAIVAERIGWYVYALVDPRDGCLFYIGKGTGNRVFAHAEAALALEDENEATAKLSRIRAVHAAGVAVRPFIVRHGISSERQAYEVEAAVIDVLRLLAPDLSVPPQFELANVILGHRHAQFGLAHVDVVESLYDAPAAPPFSEPMLLLRIPDLWTPLMLAEDLYQATRGWWVIGDDRRSDARLACSVHRGVIRAVYRIERWRKQMEGDRGWEPNKRERWGFDGVRDPEMEARYVNTSVGGFFKRGDANPVKLVSTARSSEEKDTLLGGVGHEPAAVPSPASKWRDMFIFAHSYSGYLYIGEADVLVGLAYEPIRKVVLDELGDTPDLQAFGVDLLRAALFYQGRMDAHVGRSGFGSPEDKRFYQALVAELGRRCGDWLPWQGDPADTETDWGEVVPNGRDGIQEFDPGGPKFDLAYAPPRYPQPAPGSSGSWRPVISNGVKIAYVFTNFDDAAGVTWVAQPPEITQLNLLFRTMKGANMPPGSAYLATTAIKGIDFGSEESGLLDIKKLRKNLMLIADET